MTVYVDDSLITATAGRRQAAAEIAVIVATLASRGLRLHGFGVKTADHPGRQRRPVRSR